MGEQINLDNSSDRTAAAKEAGDDYVKELEIIISDLNGEDGQSLGDMVEANLKMTEAETSYNVKSGIPNKASNVVKDVAGMIKKATG